MNSLPQTPSLLFLATWHGPIPHSQPAQVAQFESAGGTRTKWPKKGGGGFGGRSSLRPPILHSAARIRTMPVLSISAAPCDIMLFTKCAARSPCQVMSVITSVAAAWPTAVLW